MDNRLPDASARSVISTELESTLLVEASAGTGKTEALVNRVLTLVASGKATIDRVAVITFTVAAAAELEGRIRSAIERSLSSADGPLELSRLLDLDSDEISKNLETALKDLDKATVSTIHAFARLLLSSYPLQAGIPPGFEVLSEIEASLAFRDEWKAFLNYLFASEAESQLLRKALLLGIRISHLEELAKEFHKNWDRVREMDLGEDQELPVINPQGLADALAKAIDYRSSCSDSADRLYQRLESLRPLKDSLTTEDQDELLDILISEVRLANDNNPINDADAGKQAAWGGADRKLEVRQALTEAKKEFDALLTPLRQAVLHNLIRLLRAFALEAVEARRLQGKLEFHDILVHARDLLKKNPEVRRAVRRQFSHILVDEFQDTDPLQVEICSFLAAPDGEIHMIKDWHELKAEQGKIFFVGDPKQSIYRFRRADISTYMKVKDFFGGKPGPTSVNLTVNFRSHYSVAVWVNEVCSRIIQKDPDGGQPEYVPLDPSRTGEHPDSGSRVWIMGGPVDLKADEMRASESRQIVAAIKEICKQGWTVDTRNSAAPDGVGPGRRAQLKDIAVLIKSRTSIPQLELAFQEAEIPYTLEARSLLLHTQEVRDMLHLLTAIADESDDIAIIAALRSPAFGCSDRDLIAYYRAVDFKRQAWNPPGGKLRGAPENNPVTISLERIHRYREEQRWRGASNLIEYLVSETRLLQKAMWSPNYRESWRRYRFVADRCRAFLAAGGKDLLEFVGWMREQANESGDRGDTLLADPDENAVRITTIHASKGLQYPIVIIAGIGTAFQSNSRPCLLWDQQGNAVVSLANSKYGLKSPTYDDVYRIERNMEQLELRRLLYVAMTRAEDHLLVSLYHRDRRNSESDSGASIIWRAIQEGASGHRDFEELLGLSEDAAGGSTAQNLETKPATHDEVLLARQDQNFPSVDSRDEWIAARRRKIDQARRTPIISATAIAGRAGLDTDILARSCLGNSEVDVTCDSGADWGLRRGRSGRGVGRAVHAVLELIDLETGDGLEEIAHDQALLEQVLEDLDQVRTLSRSILNSNAVKEAVQTGEYWREVFVGAMFERDYGIEGYVDLLYRTPNGLVVVDYKTDRIDNEAEIDKLLNHYQYQGAAYASAIERATKETVARVTFVFATHKQAIEKHFENFDKLRTEIDLRLRQIANAS